jgi:hypothetical protein
MLTLAILRDTAFQTCAMQASLCAVTVRLPYNCLSIGASINDLACDTEVLSKLQRSEVRTDVYPPAAHNFSTTRSSL